MATASPNTATVSSAYAIFEGGGAKGIAHTGALRALEAANIAIVGVAGTSAGAIIAALVAVGYSAEEVFRSGSDNILTRLGYTSPVDVLGKREWKRVRNFKRNARVALGVLLLGAVLFLVSLGATFTQLVLDWQTADLAGYLVVAGGACVAFTLGFFGLWFWRVLKNGGIFSNSSLVDLVNEALRAKLAEHYAELGIAHDVPDIVLFEHIDPAAVKNCIPLKVIVTNVTDGTLTLFDARNAKVSVAEVVAASAALPLAFRPASIKSYASGCDRQFTDGGLVSNLPTWVFKEEKRTRERLETAKGGYGRIPIYAFSLSSGSGAGQEGLTGTAQVQGSRKGIRRTFVYYKNVILAGIFGSQPVVQNFITDLKVVPIKCDLATIDFDCTGERAEKAHKDGMIQADSFLSEERLRDFVTQTALDAIIAKIENLVSTCRGGSIPRLRAALVDPVFADGKRDIVGFRVAYGAKMDAFADDRMELDPGNSIAATAFNDNDAVFGEVAGKTPGELRMTKYEHALLPRDLASVIAVPIFAKSINEGNPQRILCVDSSDSLRNEFDNRLFMHKLRKLSFGVSRNLIDTAVETYIERQKHAQAHV